MCGVAAHSPRMGARHRALVVCAVVRWRALIQSHDDVCAKIFLHRDAMFRGEAVLAAVNMRAEGHAVRIDFADVAQRKDLEAARVREDGTGPLHKFMQAAKIADELRTRT